MRCFYILKYDAGDAVAHTFQAALYRAVQACAAKIQPQAAQNRRIDFGGQPHRFAGHLLQFGKQLFAGSIVQRHGGDNGHFNNAVVGIIAVTISADTAGQFCQQVFLAQQF